jgi:hypothetical protein
MANHAFDIVIKNNQLRFALHRKSHPRVWFNCAAQTQIYFPAGLFETKPKGQDQATLPAGESYLTLDPKMPAGDYAISLGPSDMLNPSQPIIVDDGG